ncbi:hypothetical protein GEMRC1_005561 [Eukaryota sp. GEM-RC1]
MTSSSLEPKLSYTSNSSKSRSVATTVGNVKFVPLPGHIGKSTAFARTLPTSQALHQPKHLNSAEHGSVVGTVLESEMDGQHMHQFPDDQNLVLVSSYFEIRHTHWTLNLTLVY